MTKLLLGTMDGVRVLEEGAGGWESGLAWVRGREVHSIAVSEDGGGMGFAATRGEGLFRIDLASGYAEKVGAGVLPAVLRCVAVSPHDPSVVYVGTEPAALFVSADGGTTWRQSRGLAELVAARKWLYPVKTIPPHIRFILPDARDPDTVYAAGQVGGLLKSTDGGESWVDFTDGIDPDVHSVAQDPSDPRTLYVITGGGGDIVHGYPPPAPQGRPIYRSTDGGGTWACISQNFDRTYAIQMVIDPDHPERMATAVARGIPSQWTNRPEKADAVIVHSPDGGATWAPATGELPDHFNVMIEAMTSAGGGTRIFAGTGGQTSKRFEGEATGEVYGSDAFGSGWRRIARGLPSIFSMTEWPV
jgi:photosystem II stability/assembly factor-like uncharacterized protein